MTKSWSEVAGSSGFKQLPPEQQDSARRQYFDDVVAPKVPDGQREIAWDQFSTDVGVGRRELPAGVEPSRAGAGRGSVNRPLSLADAKPTRAELISAMDEATDEAGPNYIPLTENAQNALRTSGRNLMDAKRTKSPGRVIDADIPGMTPGSVARDTASGVMQIVPTTLKGVGELSRLATGDRVGKGLSEFADDTNKAVQQRVGSERSQLQRQRFEQDMADPAMNAADVVVGNPGALADQVLPTVGSMALPVGAASTAGKLAQASKAAQLAKVIDEGTVLARANAAREAAAVGTTVAQNAASTYSTVRDKGGDQAQSYLAAALTAPATYIAGRVTGGAAEAQAAKLLSGAGGSAGRAAASIPKGMAKEGGQEMVEEAGQVLGETTGLGEEFDAGAAGKRVAVAGTLGAVVGGGVDASGQVAQFAQERERVKRLKAAGETDVADMLERRVNLQEAEANTATELGALIKVAPQHAEHPAFQQAYKTQRVDGVKPAEAAARAAITTGFGELAAQSGLSQKAIDSALDAVKKMPMAKVPGFLDRYVATLNAKGMGTPVEPGSIAGTLSTVGDTAMTAAVDSLYADDVRQAMSDVEALESQQNQAPAVETPAPAATQTIAPVSVRPEIDLAAHDAATSPLNNTPEPTQAQKEAGNYRKGHIKVQGMDIAIENPEGSQRSGTSPDGTEWTNTMAGHYGYIKGTVGNDKDHVDTYVGHNPDGKFDEHKVMLGYDTPEQAQQAYRDSFDADWQGFGAMTELPVDAFKSWVRDGVKSKPLGKLQATDVQNAPVRPRESTETQAEAAAAQAPAPEGSDAQGPAAARSDAGEALLETPRVILGRNNVPMEEGGKPYKTRLAADEARRQQPMMRVIRTDGGFALTEKTAAQLAAQEKAAQRLRNPQTSQAGQPIPAHAMIASAGGLAPDERADMGMDGNVTVGSRKLFAGEGKGLTIERATEKLIDDGYLPEGAGHDQARALIKRSLTQPQYTAEGFERMAEAETQGRFDAAMTEEEAVDEAVAQIEALSDNQFDVLLDAEIPWDEPSNTDTAAAMKALGFTNQEIEDATANQSGEPQDDSSGRGEPDEGATSQAQADTGDRGQTALETEEVNASAKPQAPADAVPKEPAAGAPGAAAAGPLDGAAQGGDPREPATPVTPAFESKLRADGTLAITGDAKAIREILTAIPAKSLASMKGGVLVGRTQADKAAAILRGEKPKLTAREAAEAGQAARKAEKKAKAAAARAKPASEGFKVGIMPGNAEPVTVKDGVVYIGKAEALDFDNGDPVRVPAGATDQQIAAALKDAGALSRRQRIFGLGKTEEGEGLTAPTKEDVLAQQQAAADGTKAEAKAATAAENKSKADAQRGEFTLTGSDRAADVGAAGGQKGMFARGVWRSELGDQIAGSQMNASQPAGWKTYIDGLTKKGVKPDEIEWSGVREWLDLQTGKVTKVQVLEFLNANGVKVEETMLGAPVTDLPKGWTVAENTEETGLWEVLDAQGVLRGDGNTRADAIESAQDHDERAVTDAKYGKYQLPGGENYRELLLTLPVEKQRVSDETARSLGATEGWDADKFKYKSSHWDQGNILAHIRFNERTDADGKKVLFIEEIQSDWAQEGKKNGFVQPKLPSPGLPSQFTVQQTEYQYLVADPASGLNVAVGKGTVESEKAAREYANRYFWSKAEEKDKAQLGRVQTAPFVGKTDAWVALAIKRMVSYAAENGFDKVAFVNGEQSAERYDLSKQVDRIAVPVIDDEGSRVVLIDVTSGAALRFMVSKDGIVNSLLGPNEFDGKPLSEVIGKDVAERVMKAKAATVLEGDGLRVGGDGMKAFYDKIVPTVAKDVLRKLGGGQLENVRIEDPLEPSNIRRYDGGRISTGINSSQLGFDITPAMREKATAGLPMFAKGFDPDAFARMFRPPTAMAITDVQKAVDKLTSSWKSGPTIKVVETPADLPITAPADARGLIHEGTAYIVARNHVNRDAVARTLGHEAIGHYGLWRALGDDGTKKFNRNLQMALKSGNVPLGKLRDKIRASYVDKDGKYNLSPAEESSEIAAFAVEAAIDPATGEFKPGFGFVKEVYAKVAEFLRSLLGDRIKFTNSELHGMLVAAMRGLKAGHKLDGGVQGLVAAARTPPAALKAIPTPAGTAFQSDDVVLGKPRLNVRQPGGDVTRVDFEIRDPQRFAAAKAAGATPAEAREASNVGYVVMDVGKDGQFKSLRNIEVFESKRGGGLAGKVVGSIMGTLPEGGKLHIHDILPTATGFWDKMGAKFARSEDYMEAFLTPAQFRSAYANTETRAAGEEGPSDKSGPTLYARGREGGSGDDGQAATAKDAAKAGLTPTANGASFGQLHHGSATAFKTFSPPTGKPRGGAYDHQGPGFYLTSDADGFARFFARTAATRSDTDYDGDGVVLDVKLKPEARILDMRAGEVDPEVARLFKNSTDNPKQGVALRERVLELGYDGLAFTEPNFPDGWKVDPKATTVVVYEPSVVDVGTKNQTVTPAFKKWFGDSKVVDDAGRPRVMYHGTKKDMSEFRSDFDDVTAPGVFFTADPRYASQYAGTSEFRRTQADGGNVVPAYLSIQNPKSVSVEDYWDAIRSKSESKLIAKAKAAGHDGIFVKDFIDNLTAADMFVAFEPSQIKSAIGNNGDFDGGNPNIAFARGTGNLFQPNIWSMPEATRTDRVIYELQDGKVDLKRAQEAIKASGQDITEQYDARLAETLYPGRVAYRSATFLDVEAKPLLEAMARNKVGMDELADYLHARGAEERNAQIAKVNKHMPDGGAGTNTKGELMTNQAARDYLAAVPKDRKAVLDAMAARVDAITKGTRSMLVAEGLEKQETIDAWEGAYKNYVPMFRDEAETAMPPHPQGAGFQVKGNASRRATGSTKEVTNILAHVLMQREAAITRAEKNRVALALYGQALSHPNPDFWTTIRPSMKAAEISAELQAMGVDPMTAEVGMEGVPTIRTVDPITQKVVDRPNPIYRNLPGAIPLKVNGADRVLMLNTKTERGQRMAESLKNLDGLTQLDIAGNIIGKSTRWIAAVNTQYNPAFGLVNLTRDTLGGAINLGSTELRGNALKVLAKTPAAILGIARELASGGQTGTWQSLYRQFQADGGQTGFKENFRDPNDRAKAVEKELAALGRSKLSPGHVTHAILDLLDGFNTTLENAVRLSAYKAALDKGMSRAEAARLGRELTVDFNRKGRAGREVGPLYAFFNASVQGGARTIQALKGPTGSKIIAGGLSLGILQALMLAAAGYDDDDIPEFIKTRALIVPLFGREKKYVAIPYPLGLHVLPNTGRVMAELTLNGGKDIGKRTVNAIGEIASAFNPLGGGNIFTADGALKTVAPTVVDPFIELSANKNFAGGTIEKAGFGSESDNRPGVARAKESTQRSTTGQAYMAISSAINKLTGGTDYEAGMVSPTPERVRYIAQTVGGGVLRELEKTINASTTTLRGEKVKMSGIPVAGRFYGEVDDDQVQTSRYFERARTMRKIESSVKAATKAGDFAAADKIEDANPEAALIRTFNRTQRAISALNKEAVQTIGNREEMAQIDKDRAQLMREFNEDIAELEREAGKVTLADRLRKVTKPMLADAK